MGKKKGHQRSLSGHTPAIDVAEPRAPTVEAYVRSSGGATAIKSILIANNGIAAVKCMRSIRRWAYETFGQEKAIKFVAMVTPEDLEANAEYVHLADHYVDVPGGTNNNNYANVDLIVEIAKEQKVQAVWAGWGHASENPKLPEELKRHKIIFMGPPANAMRSLGDKISSSIVAQSAQVPTLPWSGSGLTVDCQVATDKEPLQVPDDIYAQGCVDTFESAIAAAKKIGFPVMIKASEGGGGKGIRKVTEESDFEGAYKQVLQEVAGSPVFIMKLANAARHLEVQVLADAHGNCIALHGRDCSVQRRHQKIIEEAPVSVAPTDTFHEMEQAAIRLSKLVGYVSAGTIEYLYDEEKNEFHFLELNPRLQVEHPCSEMVCGVNLPAAQLQVAMGIPLHNMPDIRAMYQKEQGDTSPINFQQHPEPNGHVIACRITAENPEEGFKPNSGTVQELNFRSSADVWGYFSVASNSSLHEFADSQFGHCFAWGKTRDQARHAMVVALRQLSIRADFRNTSEYLVKLLEHADFVGNKITTEWLDGLIVKRVAPEKPDVQTSIVCAACAIADLELHGKSTEFCESLRRGQILPESMLSPRKKMELILDNIKYRVQIVGIQQNKYAVVMNDSYVTADVRQLSDGGCIVRCQGKSSVTYVHEDVTMYRATIDGMTCTFEKEMDPSVCRATSTGKLVRYLVENGAHVRAGDRIAEMESMKMVLYFCVEASGIIKLELNEGSNFKAGDVIATLVLDDMSQVKRPKLHKEPFAGNEQPDAVPERKPLSALNAIVGELTAVMDGFSLTEKYFDPRLRCLVDKLVTVCKDRRLPIMEIREILSAINAQLPKEIYEGISTELQRCEKSIESYLWSFPAQQIDNVIYGYVHSLDTSDPNTKGETARIFSVCQPILIKTKEHRLHKKDPTANVLIKLLERYLDVEGIFSRCRSYEVAIDMLKDKYNNNYEQVAAAVRSHGQLAAKNKLLTIVLEVMETRNMIREENQTIVDLLQELASLGSSIHSKIALLARQALMRMKVPSYDLRRRDMLAIFKDAMGQGSGSYETDGLRQIISSSTAVFDTLSSMFYHESETIRQAALEVYVSRAYIAYTVVALEPRRTPLGAPAIRFKFHIPTNAVGDPDSRIEGSNIEEDDMDIARDEHGRSPVKFAISGDETPLSSYDETPITTPPPERRRTYSNDSVDIMTEDERVVSIGNFAELRARLQMFATVPERTGVIAIFQSMDEVAGSLDWLKTLFDEDEASSSDDDDDNDNDDDDEFLNVLNIVVRVTDEEWDDDLKLLDTLQEFVKSWAQEFLFPFKMRRLTMIVCKEGQFPMYFTFRKDTQYLEDAIYRHLDPALAYKLEMFKLDNYNITRCHTKNPRLHLYYGEGKDKSHSHDHRFFARAIMRSVDLVSSQPTVELMQEAGQRLLLECLDEMEVVFSDPQFKPTDANHVFINFVPPVVMDPMVYAQELEKMITHYGERLWKLRVTEAEIRLNVRKTATSQVVPVRVLMSNCSGYCLTVHVYKEAHTLHHEHVVYRSYDPTVKHPLHGKKVGKPYPLKDKTQLRRFQAQQRFQTTYVYDYIDLFKEALTRRWQAFCAENVSMEIPRTLIRVAELVLTRDGKSLVEQNRRPGQNSSGMVAWRITMITPEHPAGRDIILIANDITFVNGSFSPLEDDVFYLASELARKEGLPRIYIACNSGARINLANSVLEKIRVAWNQADAPWKGFRYLYVSEDDYKWAESQGILKADPIDHDGERRYKITDVIGQEHGIGVENLRGSGRIAGETSLSYESNFTLTVVSARTVGIGAYLVRLGHRTIQAEQSHIILTGHHAINKLLGKEVYASSQQLGGPRIMFANGVTHRTSKNDFDSVCEVLNWLSYVPHKMGAPLPQLRWCISSGNRVAGPDPIDRAPSYVPSGTGEDPRFMIEGRMRNGEWQSGLFDRGSFTELLGGWAKTVVVGRARMGGIPAGVIAVETRPIEVIVPADPANPTSTESISTQAGQVWYPDSAYKTAQAIKDLDGEGLPLFILANWRGFSGGMRDMYDEVLKFGAMIVDNLRTFRQPVFVYIPPKCELRGGAWVVVDPTINPDQMEMFADPQARGGVLEPEGIVSVKFKKKTQHEVMIRLDEEYRHLAARAGDKSLSSAGRKKAADALHQRYSMLENVYHQIGVQFADLHDTAGRMKSKGCVDGVIEWARARKFFYWRLRRRILEATVIEAVQKVQPNLHKKKVLVLLHGWFSSVHTASSASSASSSSNVSSNCESLWENDHTVVQWLATNFLGGSLAPNSEIQANIDELRAQAQRSEFAEFIRDCDHGLAYTGAMALLEKLDATQRGRILEALQDGKLSSPTSS